MTKHENVPARSVGTKLHLRFEPNKPETSYDWAGSTEAHHATVVQSEHVLIYMTKITWAITIYDAAGAVLGEIEHSVTD